jgi:hypothetical protein
MRWWRRWRWQRFLARCEAYRVVPLTLKNWETALRWEVALSDCVQKKRRDGRNFRRVRKYVLSGLRQLQLCHSPASRFTNSGERG